MIDQTTLPDELPGGAAFAETWSEAERVGDRQWRNATHDEKVRLVTDAVETRRRLREQADRDPSSALWRVGARNLADIDRSPAPPLIVDRISPDGHTILFGPGNVGKGLLASSWIVQHVQAEGRVLILDFEDHPNEWARRIWGLGGADMLGADAPIRHVSPLRLGMPNWPLLADAAREHGATLLVIDSLAYAIPGMDPSDPQAATAYSAVIQPFGIPVLSLAHMNRAGDDRYPFGSVFWHAGARITWSLTPDGTDAAKLTSRKHNNYEWQGAYSVTSDWLDDSPRAVSERSYNATVAERIDEALPASLDEIEVSMAEDGVPVKRATIRRTLQRGLRDGRYTMDAGERWQKA